MAEVDQPLMAEVLDKEERLRGLLSPLESHIVWFQKVLVWERPHLSVALFLIVNVLFWLATTWRIYCLIGITGMIAVAVEMWISCVFTETYGGDGQDINISEGWTEVCPHLMGVPEISNYLAHGWVQGLQLFDKIVCFRAENKQKFFVYSVFFLSIVAVIGVYIPGIYLSYFIVMSLLLWPALSYHNIVGRIQEHVGLVIESIKQNLHVNRQYTKKSGKRGKGKRKLDALENESDGDSDIDEFIPPATALIPTSLTKAAVNPIAGDENADTNTIHVSSEFLSYDPTQEESYEHTDDELLSEDLTGLVRDIKEMPSIDDIDSAQEADAHHLLPNNDENVNRLLKISDNEEAVDNEQQFLDQKLPPDLEETDKMAFVQFHFKDESEVNEEKPTESRSCRDLHDDDVDVEERLESESKVLGVIGDIVSQSHSSLMAAFRSPVIFQTVSSAMTSTLSGIGAVRNTVVSASYRGIAGTAGEVPTPEENAASASGSIRHFATDESSDSEILESEFEFIEHEELDSLNAASND